VPTAVWAAFRKLLPWQQAPEERPDVPYGMLAHVFLKATPAATFYPAGPVMPSTEAHVKH
jgi:hypothetical protein